MGKRRRSNVGAHRKHHKTWEKSNVQRLQQLNEAIKQQRIRETLENDEIKDPGFDDFMRSVFIDKREDAYEQMEELMDSDGCMANEFFVILDKPHKYSENDDLDEFVLNERVRQFSILKQDCRSIETDQFTFVNSSRCVRFVQLYDSGIPKLKLSLNVNPDFSLTVSVNDKWLPGDHVIWKNIPKYCYSAKALQNVLHSFVRFTMCSGNNDENLQSLIPPAASLDSKNGLKYQGYRDVYVESTIRSIKCMLLMDGGYQRCVACSTYRRTLRKLMSRKQNRLLEQTPKKNWLKSKVNHKSMSENQKFHKLKQVKQHAETLEKENVKLKMKIKEQIKKSGECLPGKDSEDLFQMSKDVHAEIEKMFPDENSYQRLFWDEQLKFKDLKNKKGMRWHPMIIRWCIFLKSKSESTYDALRNSGFINLPSQRTLFDYTNYVKKGVGYRPDIIEMLHKEIYQGQNTEEHRKIVGILQDEIRIKSDLVYNKHSGELIGFIDLGKVNNDIQNIEECIRGQDRVLAKYVLVVMVRGISTNLKFPLAHFATNGITSDQLFPILWKAVEILEVDLGLTVLFITSDGASPNRRFARLHRTEDGDQVVYRALNIYAANERYIYFISDPPHLIKTARNCFSNSFSHKKSRKLWNKKDISWLHIVDLFKDHCSGMYRRCPKLTRAHIDITSFGCMKVSYAAQVLSSTVADALESLYGEQTTETVEFIRHMNRFFDIMNTRSYSESVRKRNEDLKPFDNLADPRLEFLLHEFLNFFESWKNNVENRPGNFTKGEKSAMQLSYQTLEGIKMTVCSVVECIRFCLGKGMKFVLTERFNQDPIEQHFGMHRINGGCNTNPTLDRFNDSIVRLRTVGSQAIAPLRGNTKRNTELAPIDEQPLPKRKK